VAAKLAKLEGLRVVDVASAHLTPANLVDPEDAGRALGANYLLRATVRWFRDVDGTVRAQVSPTLIQVSDGSIKWVGAPQLAFLADPFTPQSSLATQAALELGIELGAAQKAILASRGTRDTAAFAAFQRGNSMYWRGTQVLPSIPEAALSEFERAAVLDPKYGDALASAAELMSREAVSNSRPELLDSIARAARRALAVAPGHPRALVASARVAMLRDKEDDALKILNAAIDANPSSVEALQLRSELNLLGGDSASVWRDVERIVKIAPRSPNALIGVAHAAIALRRFDDAREYLRRARALVPRRPDVVLQAAELARQTGNVPEMIRLVYEARSMGGTLSVNDLALLRAGDSDMQAELISSSPGTFGAKTAVDTFAYYMEKGKLFLQRHKPASTRAFDTASVALGSIMENRGTSNIARRMYIERGFWLEAAHGNGQRALAGMTDITQSIQRYPNGAFAAFVNCNDAETYALMAWVEKMLPALEQCLRLPGGYSVNAVLREPALALWARDPRVSAMLSQMGLNLDRQ
jgi:tetratricopeptide (TPR) repeat protein